MKLIKKIIFIGPVNLGVPPKGGDEYKNQLAVLQLGLIYDLKILDTVGWKRNPKLLVRMIYYLVFNKLFSKIIISASTLSALKLITIANVFVKNKDKMVYWVIGGELDKILLERTAIVPILKRLKSIIVETYRINENLREMGFLNTQKVSNFKEFNTGNLLHRQKKESKGTLHLVFLSRICESKGVDVIFKALDNIPNVICEVDFYGPIDQEYKELFLKEIGDRENMEYKGYLNLKDNFEESIDILSTYDLFLFPTFWKSEGHAGVLIDAMCAGLGIIATDWNSNSEFISDNGTLIKPKDAHSLERAIMKYFENPELVVQHGNASLENVKEYHISNIFPQYLATLN